MELQTAVLTTTSKIFSTDSRKSRPMSEGGIKSFISKKIVLLNLLLWTGRMHFWHPGQKIFENIWLFVAQSPTMIQKVINFSKKLMVFKVFLWRCRMRFWQNQGHKVSRKTWKVFSQKPEKIKNEEFSVIVLP